MAENQDDKSGVQVPQGTGDGVASIPSDTPLTRMHYFEGRYLRAADLEGEQTYHRMALRASNRAGGAGVVYGFSVSDPGGAVLQITAGLAFDCEGRTLLLPRDVEVRVSDLVNAAERVRASATMTPDAGDGRFYTCVGEPRPAGAVSTSAGEAWWVLRIAHAEQPCGQEAVYGKICNPACETTTEYKDLHEGVYFWLDRLAVDALPTSTARPPGSAHLRSRIASAYFKREGVPDDGLLGDGPPGLLVHAWCEGAREPHGGSVPLALIVIPNSGDRFIDMWTVRRERMEPPPRRFWALQMRMRPWSSFLAQVLQFQCQLAEEPIDDGHARADGCGEVRDALKEARRLIETLLAERGRNAERSDLADPAMIHEADAPAAAREELSAELRDATRRYQDRRLRWGALSDAQTPQQEQLIARGIVELPPAGYLPVRKGDDVESVNDQVRRLVGAGVDLRFCAVRHDYVAHALEEAQHLERISLTQGLDDVTTKPEVDILVPDGVVVEAPTKPGPGFETVVLIDWDDKKGTQKLQPTPVDGAAPAAPSARPNGDQPTSVEPPEKRSVLFARGLRGAARYEAKADGSLAIAAAVGGYSGAIDALDRKKTLHFAGVSLAAWLQVALAKSPLDLVESEATVLSARGLGGAIGKPVAGAVDGSFEGVLQLDRREEGDGFTDLWLTLAGAARAWARSAGSTAVGGEGDGRVKLAVRFSRDERSARIGVGMFGGDGDTPERNALLLNVAWRTDPLRIGIRASVARWFTSDDGPQREGSQDPTPTETDLDAFLTAVLADNRRVLESMSARELGAVELTWSEDALSPASDTGRRAASAIALLAKTRKEASYAEILRAIVFAPLAPRSRELTIRATHDWVMFHRRRTRRCEAHRVEAKVPELPPTPEVNAKEPEKPPPPPPPPPPRDNVVYLFRAKSSLGALYEMFQVAVDRPSMGLFLEAIQRLRSSPSGDLRRLGVERFDVATDTLRRDLPDHVESQWQRGDEHFVGFAVGVGALSKDELAHETRQIEDLFGDSVSWNFAPLTLADVQAAESIERGVSVATLLVVEPRPRDERLDPRPQPEPRPPFIARPVVTDQPAPPPAPQPAPQPTVPEITLPAVPRPPITDLPFLGVPAPALPVALEPPARIVAPALPNVTLPAQPALLASGRVVVRIVGERPASPEQPQFAVRRLEYSPDTVHFEGDAIDEETFASTIRAVGAHMRETVPPDRVKMVAVSSLVRDPDVAAIKRATAVVERIAEKVQGGGYPDVSARPEHRALREDERGYFTEHNLSVRYLFFIDIWVADHG